MTTNTSSPLTRGRVLGLAALAIVAFAGNSLLTRAALADGEMDAGAFGAIRLFSGAAMLALLALSRAQNVLPKAGDISGAGALFVYMAGFSYAYNNLDAATGALILFGVVQLTIIAAGLMRGARPGLLELAGAAMAFGGLVWLVGGGDAGGAGADMSYAPVLLMAAAGVGWGAYTLLGRGAGDPLGRTARNFVGATPPAVIAVLLFGDVAVPWEGVLLAIASGAITSGLGYAVWYAVLPDLSRMTAGVSQLLVPPVTALGGALLLSEPLTLKLAVASAIILAGVALTTLAPSRSG